MVVSTILQDARNVLGQCSAETVFARISAAVEMANNSAKFDAALGTMDLCVCDGCVTLPADVATVLAVNIDGHPSLMRDQWFQFHINGAGSQRYQPWSYTDELGAVSTYKDPAGPVKLVAVVENAQDSSTPLRVFGWDENGKRIYTLGASGLLEDGFIVPTVFGFSVPSPTAPNITRIERVEKPVTNGFIRLLAVNPDTLQGETQIGYYLPWETSPSYRRIKVPDRSWIRIKYRKKDLKVRGASDWINIENTEALILLLKAVKARRDEQLDKAAMLQGEGMKLLSDEAEALRPSGISPPQIIFDSFPCDYDRLYY